MYALHVRKYVCMYVCMHVCMYACMYVFMQAIPLCYVPNKLHIHRPTQHRFIVIAPYMYVTYFGPFSGHHQARQFKNHLQKDAAK